MMKTKLLPIAAIVVLLLSACSLAANPSASGLDQAAVQQTVAAAQTAAVDAYKAANPAQPAAPAATAVVAPTYTPFPTYTPYPTYTAVVVPTEAQPVVPTAGAAATQAPKPTTPPVSSAITHVAPQFACQVTSVSPAYGAELARGVDFDAKFTLKNTGSFTWGAPDYDIVYIYGPTGMAKNTRIDLPKDVTAGGTVDITEDMFAPSTPGTYSAEFVLMGSATICQMDISINVK
jgi:hypothetical protein